MCSDMHVKRPFVWMLLNGTTCLFVLGQDLIQDNSTTDQITMPNIMRKPASLTLMHWKIHTRSSKIKGPVPSIVPFSKQGSWEIKDGNYQSDADSLLWRNRCLAMKVHDKPKFSNMFGWGDFYSNVKTVKLNLLIKGKVVDHGNGSLGVFFRHNSTGEGNVSVSLVPPTKEVKFDLERQSVVHSKSSKTFNCRIDYEKVERDKKLVLCNFNPSKTCAQVQTQSQVTWICSKPFRVICVYVSFYSTDYRLVQKICPDYKYHSQGPYLPSG